MRRLSSKEIALIVCFAAIYAVTSHFSLFPVIGAAGRSISAGTMISLVAGLIIGPFLGGLAILIGGLVSVSINLSQGALGLFSPLPHVAAAISVGALKNRKQVMCAFTYLLIFLFFAFFPVIGPVWIWPQMLWLHIISIIVMASPIQSTATQSLSSSSLAKLTFGIAVTFFTSTLFSQIVGSTIFVLMNMGYTDSSYWLGVWQGVTFIYPLERAIITAAATTVAIPVLKTLRAYGFKV